MNPKSFRLGKDLYRDLFSAIGAAKESIFLNTYTFRSDKTGWEFVAALAKKARAGLKVKIIFDAFGSRWHEEALLNLFSQSKIEARVFRPLPGILFRHPLKFLCRNHARIFLFDEKVFGTGGAGFGDIYLNREDFSVLHQLGNSKFISEYCRYLWELAEKSYVPPFWLKAPREIFPGVSALVSGPLEEEQEIYRWSRDACGRAKDRIIISSPFFFPTKELLNILIERARKGVRVEIITPLRTDRPYYDRFRGLPAPILVKNGARWWGVKKYFHQKYFIIDDLWTCGSANFDIFSMKRNYELNICGRGGPLLVALEKIAEEEKLPGASVAEFPSIRFFGKIARLAYPLLGFLFAWT